MAAILDTTLYIRRHASRYPDQGRTGKSALVSGQNRYIVDPASSTLNDNFQGPMFALKFTQRVTFQLIPFREWRGSPSDDSPQMFQTYSRRGNIGAPQQIQHLIAFVHPLHEEHIARPHFM
jgi:hypothetical protein